MESISLIEGFERYRVISLIVAWRNYRESDTRPGFESRGDPSTRLRGLSKYFTALIREFTDSRSHAMQAIANATPMKKLGIMAIRTHCASPGH